MKKLLSAFCIFLLTASSAQADLVTVTLDTPANGRVLLDDTVVTTGFTDASGATFDLLFTLNSISRDTATFSDPSLAGISGTGVYGVASSTDNGAGNFNTLDGDDGEGLSFTSLVIDNFQANGSGFTAADFTDLTFSSVSFTSTGNNQDGVNFSFGGFADHVNSPLTNAGNAFENVGMNPFATDATVPFALTELDSFNGSYCSCYRFVPQG